MEILELPPIEPKILEAINKKELAIFIGAGVSRLVGCDGWDKLAKNLLDRCFKERIISKKGYEALKQINDQKKKITISYRLFEKSKNKEAFFDEMKKSIKYGLKLEIPNIYETIEKIPALKITTNADHHLSNYYLLENIKWRIEDFTTSQIKDSNLFQIHGRIEDPDTLVFQLNKYFELYNTESFQIFMKRIFKNYTILFIGYGLGEFELLDYLFQKIELEEGRREHFMLSPFYIGEEKICELEQLYYSDLGITLIPYAKDYKEYKQLENILDEWYKEIKNITFSTVDIMKEIDTYVR